MKAFNKYIYVLLLSFSLTVPAAASPTDEGELKSEMKKAEEAVGRSIGNYTLIDQDGKSFELKELLGKPLVVSFIFTNCSLICPTITNHIHDAVMASGKHFGSKFTVLTIGFDAENDIPSALRSYGENFTKDFKNWRFATADKETIDKLSKEIGFYYRKSDRGFAHINLTTIIDSEGRVYKQVYGMVFKPEEVLKPIEYSLLGIPPDRSLSLIDRIKLFCYQYDPATGTYKPDYTGVVKLILIPSAQLIMVFFGIYIFRSVREADRRARTGLRDMGNGL